jgi:cytoskeleton protein RodZ
MNAQTGGQGGAGGVEPATPGSLLRQAREQRELSVHKAAEELHLDVWIIEALEANRFSALGAPVYAKGHLRKYATLLGVAPAAVIELYEGLSDTPVVPTLIPITVAAPLRAERPSMEIPLWTLGVALALGTMWAIYALMSGSPTDTAVPPPPETLITADTPAQGEPQAAAQEVVQPQPLPAGTAAANPTAAIGKPVRLRLEFAEPSWTEIHDSTGQRLMFGTGEAGSVRTVTGVPPLQVMLGFAAAVRMQVNGAPAEVPRRAGANAVKFVIEADGSVSRPRAGEVSVE